MKLKAAKEAILSGLQKVQSVVSTRTTLPVLSNILLKGGDGRLALTATDLEMSVCAFVEAEVSKAGETTLPARHLAAIMRELPGDQVEMDVDERDITVIRSESAVFRLNGIRADEFPPVPVFEAARTYVIERAILKQMLQRTSYAASTDEGRQVLMGVLLSFREGMATVVATDGRRLALAEQELEFPKEVEGDLVLPPKTVAELIRVLEGEGPVKIQTATHQVAFDSGDMVLLSKLIEGSYPNFRQVIPAQCDQKIKIDREVLLSAVRRVALLTSEQSNSIKMKFAKNRLDISASTPDVGEACETVPIKYSAKEISVSFNPQFLIDPLRNLVSDEIAFELNDEVSPGVVKAEEAFLYVIMPMRMS